MSADRSSAPQLEGQRNTVVPEGDKRSAIASSKVGGRRDLLVRTALFVLCLLLSVEALAAVSRWRANRDRLNEILSQASPSAMATDNPQGVAQTGGDDGEDTAETMRRVVFERTPHHAKLTVARSLVYQALAFGEAVPTERLLVARELALEVLDQQPNNWQASMFLGAATYLDWSLRSDRRLYTAAAEWEQPLIEALEQAAGKSEPRRFLVAAYLETWAALSAAKKAFVLELVKTMFREDPGSFDRLGPAWFEAAGDQGAGLEVIPELPAPWRTLEKSFAAKHDWESFSLAHGRYLDALSRQLSGDLEEATQRLRLGDLAGGRQMCLTVIASSPRDGRFAELVTRALELYPPGLRGLSSKEVLNAWLRWALDLHEIGIDPFNPKAVSRLTDAIGELEAPTGALAALIADDAYRINRYEKLAESLQQKEWATFLIAKSQWLIDREDLDSASGALGEVHRSAKSRASYWLARRRLARATGDLSDLATAEDRLVEFHARQWRASDWRWLGRRVKLELYPEVQSTGLQVTFDKVPAKGGVAELLWDGNSVAVLPVTAQQTTELALAIEPGPHLLELRSLAGGEIQPGLVRLLD